MKKTVYEFTAKKNNGEELAFSDFRNRPILIVNTASKCGFTGQYAGLESLHKEYGPQGLVVIGFPCDQFAHQEPGNDEEIAQFCSLNYGVTFQLMKKIEVNGRGTLPLYDWLKKQAPGALGSSVKWNFTKFLVSSDGATVKRFAPTVEPEDLKGDIEQEL
ncbi:MAG TPA: glutathione peroxidase [Sphaerochaetaceae bacterium]|nr:glutathione peroxidase [Sphaerochaetaceae bacterium]